MAKKRRLHDFDDYEHLAALLSSLAIFLHPFFILLRATLY